jgi:hypothetical protein
MSRIDAGQVEVELGEQTYVLKPTLSAMLKIDRKFGSIRTAMEQCGALSLDAVSTVVAAGAGLGSREAGDVPEAVFKAGVVNVATPVVEYLALLINPTGRDAESVGEGKS